MRSSLVPFLMFCLLLARIALSLPLLPLWFAFFSILIFDVSTSNCLFHPVYFIKAACGLLGFRGDLYTVPHAFDTYVRRPLFWLCLRCRRASVIMYVYYSLLVYQVYFNRGISSTPDLLEPVLRPRTAYIYSIVEMNSCENNNNNNNKTTPCCALWSRNFENLMSVAYLTEVSFEKVVVRNWIGSYSIWL